MTRNTLPNIVMVLVLAILGVTGYKLLPMLRADADVTLPVSACNPGLQACTATLPDGSRLDFSIEPRPIRPLQPLHLVAVMTGSRANKVEVDFAGSEMEMGYNRPVLAGDNGHFIGQAILPVCVTGTMEWAATVLVTTQNHRIAIPFHFAVAGR